MNLNENLSLQQKTEQLNQTYSPIILRISNSEDKITYENLLNSQSVFYINDTIEGQIRELIKCRNVGIRLDEARYQSLSQDLLAGVPIQEYGVWVYYPWSGRLLHTLDEDEFIEVRTNRNQYKITKEERNVLATKKIGVIGLSVGQSVAPNISYGKNLWRYCIGRF